MKHPLLRRAAVAALLIIVGSRMVAARPLAATAHLWPYESLCKLPDPPDPVKTYRMGQDASVTMRGCSDLAKELGSPRAVWLHFVNTGNTEADLLIKGLASISVKGGNSGTALAIKFGRQSPLGRGMPSDIATKLEGEFSLVVLAGGAVDLVVLFKAAAVGDSIVVGDQPPVKIEK
jgi:hypothetical protein